MAIANCTVTATANVGGEVSGYVVYNGTNAWVIPPEGAVIEETTPGTLTITQASLQQVNPATVALNNLYLQNFTFDSGNPLTTENATLTKGVDYDAIGTVTISAVKLQDVTATSTLSASAGSTPLNKTDGTAWGIGTVTVNNIVTETASFTPDDVGKTVEPVESGHVLSSVTVAPVPIAGGNSATPSLVQQTPMASGGYWKSFTVNATPLQDAGTIAPTESEQNAPELTGGNIGYSTFKVGAIQTETATVKSGASETIENPSEGHYFSSVTVQALNLQEKTVDAEEAEVDVEADSSYDGLSKVTINPIQTESKTITATKEEQVVSPTSGKYLKSVTVSGYTLNLHEVEVDELTVGQEIVPEPQYDGISKVTINGVKLQDKSVNGSKSQQQVTKDDGTAWGLGTVTVGGYTPNLETKTIDELTTETGAIVPGEGYDGIGSLTVSAVKLQDVSVDPTAEGTTAQKTDGTAWGLGTVTVNAPALDEAIIVDPTESIQVKTPTGIGYKGVTVNAIKIDSTNNSATPTLEEQIKNPTEGAYFKQFTVAGAPMSDALNITPSETQQDFTPSGTLGYKGATVQAIKVATNNSATPTLEQQVINPDGGGYFKRFTVEATPLAEAQTFTPNDETQTTVLGDGNIGIKGATVNAVPVDSTTNTYTPTAEGATVNATEGQYYKSFVIAPVPTEQKTVAPADEEQVLIPTEGKFFDKVTVSADIDAPLQTKTVTPTATQQVVTPDAGYGGLSSVTVAGAPLDEAITVQSGATNVAHTPTGLGYKGVTVTGDPDLVAGNIKRGVDILGVTGTYHGEEGGTEEAGYTADEWVALDLPSSVTRGESFRYAPYYDGHYLGKTFDGGDYMAVTAYSRCGKAIATVMLNDIIGKFYIEKADVENPFPVRGDVLTLFEDVDSIDIDWTKVTKIKGNGHTIKVSESIAQDIEGDFVAEDVKFEAQGGVTDNVFTGHSKSITLNRCFIVGFESQAVKSHHVSLIECDIEGGAEGKYLLDCSGEDTVLYVERSRISGVNGIRVNGGEYLIRANSFDTTGISIDLAGDATSVDIEGNIFNNLGGDELAIEDSYTAIENIHIIGSIELNSDKYAISGNKVIKKN